MESLAAPIEQPPSCIVTLEDVQKELKIFGDDLVQRLREGPQHVLRELPRILQEEFRHFSELHVLRSAQRTATGPRSPSSSLNAALMRHGRKDSESEASMFLQPVSAQVASCLSGSNDPISLEARSPSKTSVVSRGGRTPSKTSVVSQSRLADDAHSDQGCVSSRQLLRPAERRHSKPKNDFARHHFKTHTLASEQKLEVDDDIKDDIAKKRSDDKKRKPTREVKILPDSTRGFDDAVYPNGTPDSPKTPKSPKMRRSFSDACLAKVGRSSIAARVTPAEASKSTGTGTNSRPMMAYVPSIRSSAEKLNDWGKVSSRIQSRRTTADHQSSSTLFHEEYERSFMDSCRETLAGLVQNVYFDYATLILISLNALMIGWQADYMAREMTDQLPRAARVVEVTFCAVFTLELAFRIFVFQNRFFQRPDWRWNVFDCLLVTLQLAEEFMQMVAANVQMNFSFLRVVRILRLVRVVRLMRLLRLIGELRTLVTSLSGSLKSFAWTIVLLFGFIYTTGIFFTQLVTEHRLDLSRKNLNSGVLQSYFGTLDSAIIALVQAIMGGVSWRNITDPLGQEIHWFLAFAFCVYITFCVLAMMNVVTGVFVDSALHVAKSDKDIYMVNSVRSMFRRMDIDLTGDMTWEQFEASLGTTEMREYFKLINVDITEAQGIFNLLDIDDNGCLTAEEFISGCMRISGPAKAIDLIVLLREVKELHTLQTQISEQVQYVSVGRLACNPNESPEINSPDGWPSS